MRANFWIWDSQLDSYRGISLAAEGDKLELSTGGPCDEGSSHDAETYTHCGDHVRLDYASWGSDCDGRYSSGGVLLCPLDRLAVNAPLAVVYGECAPIDCPLMPDWQKEDAYQRDYTAEAAGY